MDHQYRNVLLLHSSSPSVQDGFSPTAWAPVSQNERSQHPHHGIPADSQSQLSNHVYRHPPVTAWETIAEECRREVTRWEMSKKARCTWISMLTFLERNTTHRQTIIISCISAKIMYTSVLYMYKSDDISTHSLSGSWRYDSVFKQIYAHIISDLCL